MASSRVSGSVVALLALYAIAALSPLLAPYDPAQQHRDFSFAPPTRVHWADTGGGWHLRPFVYVEPTASEASPRQTFPSVTAPIRLWHRTSAEGLNGQVSVRTRLFGVDAPAHLFLLGTDRYGRDQLSRLLVGARLSLGAGLLGATLSIGLGFLLGGVAGAVGGRVDSMLMRAVELFVAVPWLYLLLAVRSALPLDTPPTRTFLLLVGVIGVAGWARPARLVRGAVLSGRERDYVEAARGCGASEWYVLWHHVLPQTLAIITTQAVILAPQFTLAEMTLSFFGLGVAEPLASWGTLLADAQRDHLLEPSWYAAAPLGAVVAVFILYQGVADAVIARTVRVAW